MPNLSKSKILAYRQCPKRLWLEIHQPDLRDDSASAAVFAIGNQVGEIARRLFDPDRTGVTLDIGELGHAEALARSAILLAEGEGPVFEAGLTAAGALAYVDVMLPDRSDGTLRWKMVEVKSSGSVKSYQRDDLAVQSYLAAQAGIPLSSASIAHIDNRFLYQGDGECFRGLPIPRFRPSAKPVEKPDHIGRVIRNKREEIRSGRGRVMHRIDTNSPSRTIAVRDVRMRENSNADRFCPEWVDRVAAIEPKFDSPHLETMTSLTTALQKQIPDAVLKKLGTMDESTQLAFAEEFSRKKKSPALAFWLLLPCGLHYAYAGRVWLTLIFLITFGGFGVWWFLDLFRVWGIVRERNRSIALQVLRDIQVLN